MLKKLITISIIAIASLQAATTYDKSLTDGNDALNYWNDTTDSNLNNHTLSGATEVFTIGSRENIPNIPNSSIKVTTNKLCSDDRLGQVSCSKSDSLEPRYTDDGLATSGEDNLRTWYKANTPKSVNGVVDNPCNSGTANYTTAECIETVSTTITSSYYQTYQVRKISGSTQMYDPGSSLYNSCDKSFLYYKDDYKKYPPQFPFQALSFASIPTFSYGICIGATVTLTSPDGKYSATYKVFDGGLSSHNYYTCPSGYTQINNSTCEKRTSFR